MIAQAAAREASAALGAGAASVFQLRPGLVAEMLRFYDQLRRQGQQVARFEELLEDTLRRDAEFDRGAERMLQQTRLLAAAFRAYERRVAASGGCDEHALRERLIGDSSSSPARAIVITVARLDCRSRRIVCRRFRPPDSHARTGDDRSGRHPWRSGIGLPPADS